MTEKEEKAIKIVKKFNIENRFRDGGVLNNSIDTVLQSLEKRNGEYVVIYIEVKGTNKSINEPFEISANEVKK